MTYDTRYQDFVQSEKKQRIRASNQNFCWYSRSFLIYQIVKQNIKFYVLTTTAKNVNLEKTFIIS